MSDRTPIERPNLADAFGGGVPDRAAGLSGLLGKRPDAPVLPAPTPTNVADVEKTPASSHRKQAKTPSASKAPKSQRKQAEGPPPVEATRDVGFYLDPEIVAALRAKRREGLAAGEPDRTYDELLVDALTKVTTDQLIAAFAPTAADEADGVPRRVRRPKGTGTHLIQHQLTQRQTDYLDQLETEVGAPSRSALGNTVYRLAFQPKP